MARQRHQDGWVTDDKGGNYYGHFYRYVLDETTGARKRKHELVVLGSKSEMRKWEAKDRLKEIIARELSPDQNTPRPNPSVTFEWFVQNRYIPMREARWRPTTRKYTKYQIGHYLVQGLGKHSLRDLDLFTLQIFIDKLAERFNDAVVRKAYMNLKSIMRQARKLKFVHEDPCEDLQMPQTTVLEKLTISNEQISLLFQNIESVRDRCLFGIAAFCALRPSEAFALRWKSYQGDHFTILDTTWEGKLYPNQVKTKASRASVPIPDDLQPLIAEWYNSCFDNSPDALIFPTEGRAHNKGTMVPFRSRSFMRWHILPIAERLGIPKSLVTFRVLRRSTATDLQKFGTVKDAQTILRHKKSDMTVNVYMQAIPESVRQALNSRTRAILSAPMRSVQQDEQSQNGFAHQSTPRKGMGVCKPMLVNAAVQEAGS